MDSTQELINQRLDSVRNRLLLANLFISVGSFCVGIGSFVGSVFGMNVKNYIEDDVDAFKQIVWGTCLSIFCLMLFCFLILYYAGTLPNLRTGAY